MISYNNSDIIQCLRQYDMFANSLKLVYSDEEREKIIKQLNKLLEKSLDLTNQIYEEEYNALVNKETKLLDEEKTRLTLLIDLINQRISYVERQCQNHYQLTKEKMDCSPVLGADTLDSLENKIKIIDKYLKNEKTKHELEREIKELENKIDLAKEKIQINESLNIELEKKLSDTLKNIFDRKEYQELLSKKEEVIKKFDEIAYLYNKSEENVTIARETASDYLIDCQSLVIDMKHRYKEVDNNLNIINLMEFYNKECNSYDELLIKREKINEILSHITDEELVGLIKPEVDRQYLTIKKEEQDEKTYQELLSEVNKDKDIIVEIEKENNSYEFQDVLGRIIENEKRKQEMILEEERKKQEEERQKQQEIERRRQEEISKRQRLIEENRKKDIEKRTKQLLQEQNNSVLNGNKKESFNFATLKDVTTREELHHHNEVEIPKDKNKIEEELFEEFKNNKETDNSDNNYDEIFSRINKEIKEEENKKEINTKELPEGSLDDYMKSFDENKIGETDLGSILGDDFFPSIPD